MTIKQSIRRKIAHWAPPRAEQGLRVLLYHAIDDPDPADRLRLRVSRARFLEQMTALRDDGCHVVPLHAVSSSYEHDDRVRVAITFDDGYRCQAWAAAVLREFGFPATFFVVPRFLDGVGASARYWERWGHMRWEDMAALLEQGFEVAAHSTTHPDLTMCPDERLDVEVSGARALLERRLGRPILAFSYPYGRHDRRVRRAVERAGYQLACTSRYGINPPGQSYEVCRTEVGGDDDLAVFRLKVRGSFDWLGYWQDLTAWRRLVEGAPLTS